METILIVAGSVLLILFVLYQAVRNTRSRAIHSDVLPDQEHLQVVDKVGAPVTATGTGTLAEQVGPRFNTNGMPMLNGSLDITGHAFGDGRTE